MFSCLLLLLVALLYLSTQTFRRYLDRSGPVWRELGRNSYSVYVLHVVVIGVVALLLLGVEMPSLLKYLVAVMASYLVSNLIASGYRWVVEAGGSRRLAACPGHST